MIIHTHGIQHGLEGELLFHIRVSEKVSKKRIDTGVTDTKMMVDFPRLADGVHRTSINTVLATW